VTKRALEQPKILISRRTALKTVIAGSVAGPLGCSEPSHSDVSVARLHAAARDTRGRCPMQLHGESFARAHSKRDGFSPPRSDVTHDVEIAIIGGGPSGLCALHALGDRDAVLLEKESSLGGNCSSDSWEGVRFATGAAFFTEGDTEMVELMRSIGAPGLPIVGGDALIVHGEAFHDFMGDGARRLPFPEHVREAFRRSADMAHRERHASSSRELDQRRFSDFLRPYPAELRRFWDRFGASNWGATSEHTSARLGLNAYAWLSGQEKRLSYPGGLGTASAALGQYLEARLPDKIWTSTFTHHIEPERGGRSVLVHALRGDTPIAVRARHVIVAVPKFFAARMLPHVAGAQRAAMSAFRYAPYPVVNVCLENVGPEPAYDNWFLDGPFADFIPADWVLHAGRGPAPRKTVLTVYHPLLEEQRSHLLDDEKLVKLADEVVLHLDANFPGLRKQVAETRVFRRGHALPMPTPGQLERADLASRALGPIVFAHSDSRGDVSSFPGALRAAKRAVAALG
jgi:protoporphyrinogen oxidase